LQIQILKLKDLNREIIEEVNDKESDRISDSKYIE